MREHGAAANDIGSLSRAEKGVFEQGGTESLALFAAIHGQACQQDNRHRNIASAPWLMQRGILARHRASGERVVATTRLSRAAT